MTASARRGFRPSGTVSWLGTFVGLGAAGVAIGWRIGDRGPDRPLRETVPVRAATGSPAVRTRGLGAAGPVSRR